jgi:Uma2 family endonuclease
MSIPQRKEYIKYTYKDYLKWSDEERWEIIDGVPYSMSPAPARKHQEISGELFAVIHNYLKGKTCRVYSAPFDVRLLINEETDENTTNVVQPDISVICDPSKLDDKGCKGSPDLIIEIASPSTLKKDLKDKFYLYEKALVKEYWIVYPEEKIVVTYMLNENDRYGRIEAYTDEDTIKVGIFEDLDIKLNEVFVD